MLKRMIRRYTRVEYTERVRRLLAARPDMTMSTDVIVGFPGETETDFQATLDLVQDIGFTGLFGFKYSPRPFTPALKLADDVPGPGRGIAVVEHELAEGPERLLAGDLLLQDRGHQRLHHPSAGAEAPVRSQPPALGDRRVQGLEPGGVVVGVKSDDDARTAYDEILANAKAHQADASITGVQVQKMLETGPDVQEVIVGSVTDPAFGKIVAFGLGGVLVEVLKDVTFRLAPGDLRSRFLLGLHVLGAFVRRQDRLDEFVGRWRPQVGVRSFIERHLAKRHVFGKSPRRQVLVRAGEQGQQRARLAAAQRAPREHTRAHVHGQGGRQAQPDDAVMRAHGAEYPPRHLVRTAVGGPSQPTSRSRRCSSWRAGSPVRPPCTGPGWSTVLRGALRKPNR